MASVGKDRNIHKVAVRLSLGIIRIMCGKLVAEHYHRSTVVLGILCGGHGTAVKRISVLADYRKTLLLLQKERNGAEHPPAQGDRAADRNENGRG